jgi:hypothetical protein
LAWAAVGPACANRFQFLQAGEWSTAKLTLQDWLGTPEETIQLRISQPDWSASLEVTCQPELQSTQQIPLELRLFDVGTILLEMTSRMFLGHTWLTQELCAL